jgi:HSP20 family protein
MASRSTVPWTTRLLDELWQGFEPVAPRRTRAAFEARMDVHEGDDAVVVCIDLPGVPREDVEIVAEDDVLTVRGERHSRESGRASGRRWTERAHGRFERAVRLPERAVAAKATATFEQGVLTITVPKEPDPKATAHRIEVRAA